MQTLHRVRDRLVGDRTSLMNQIRSLLAGTRPRGGSGPRRLAVALAELLDSEDRVLAPRIHELIADMRRHWAALDERIKAFDGEFAAAAKAQDGAKRLLSNSRHRRAERHSPSGGHRRRERLCTRARPHGMVGPRAATGDDGRSSKATRDHQARKQVPAQDADPGRASRAANPESVGHTCRGLATRAARPGTSQYGRRRSGGQDGPHSVGAAPARGYLQGWPPWRPEIGSAAANRASALEVCGWRRGDGLTVNRCSETLGVKWHSMPAPL